MSKTVRFTARENSATTDIDVVVDFKHPNTYRAMSIRQIVDSKDLVDSLRLLAYEIEKEAERHKGWMEQEIGHGD